MKFMKFKKPFLIPGLVLSILCVSTLGSGQAAYAERLQAVAQQDPFNMNDVNAEPGTNAAVPYGYNVSYEGQNSPYASFMQAPYQQGSVTRAYSQQPLHPGAEVMTETSPYAKYSPFIEVVGEGSDYTLGVDDVLTVIVRNQPDFSGRFVVDPEGNIQYNFVGDVEAIGRTKEELKAELVERLKKYVRYPEVAVMISEYRSKAVYVFGYVNSPGKYAMKGNKITIKEAIVAAGLPKFDGAIKRVYVIRPSEYTESGKPEKKKVNLKKMLYSGESAENFLLEPGDTIVVNQRYFDKFINNFTRIVGPVFQSAALYELGFGDRDGGIFE